MVDKLSSINIDCPDMIIDVSRLKHSSEISKLMKGIYAFAYRIKFQMYTLKIGQSDDHSNLFGERVIRQVGNLPGMNENRKSPNGQEILSTVAELNDSLGKDTVHKDWCFVDIWDVTDVPNPSVELSHHNSLRAEAILLDQYKLLYGNLPIGNIHCTRQEAYVDAKIASSVFVNGLPPRPTYKHKVKTPQPSIVVDLSML